MTGIIFAILAAVGFATQAIFVRLGLQHMRATTGTLTTMIIGAAIMLLVSAIIHPSELSAITGGAILWLIAFAFLNFPVGRLLNYTGVQMVGPSRASTIIATSPLFTMIVAVSFTNETLNTPIVIGTIAIILGGGMIVSQR